eukprot:2125517-Prymnesium_polylepis.2
MITSQSESRSSSATVSNIELCRFQGSSSHDRSSALCLRDAESVTRSQRANGGPTPDVVPGAGAAHANGLLRESRSTTGGRSYEE